MQRRLNIYPALVVDADTNETRVAYLRQGENGATQDLRELIEKEFGTHFETLDYRVKCELECIEAVGEKEFKQIMTENNVTL